MSILLVGSKKGEHSTVGMLKGKYQTKVVMPVENNPEKTNIGLIYLKMHLVSLNL